MKSAPVRFCLGCGRRKPKRELVRLVKLKEGKVEIDLTGKLAGRGGYFCPNSDCLKKGRKRLSKALRVNEENLSWEEIKIKFEKVVKEEINGEKAPF